MTRAQNLVGSYTFDFDKVITLKWMASPDSINIDRAVLTIKRLFNKCGLLIKNDLPFLLHIHNVHIGNGLCFADVDGCGVQR